MPLVYRDASGTIYPWFHWLFNPNERVDFFYNMALVGFIPWLIVALAINFLGRARGLPGRRRIGYAAIAFFAILVGFVVLFSIADVGPSNEYASRDFPQEEAASGGAAHGSYVLIPFGPTEVDTPSRFQPPGFNVLEEQITEWKAAKSTASRQLSKGIDSSAWEREYDRANPPPTAERLKRSNQSYTHLLGTVDIGQDVLARMIYGTRISMSVGIVAVSIYIVIGVVVGAAAGYFGGKVDMFISRIIEIVLLFPAFFLILTIVGLLGKNIFIIMVVIGITGWPTIARLIRGEVLKQRSLDYTLSAQALGASHARILFRHILKNSLSPALVSIPFGIAGAIITEAGLSVLGFGVEPPAPSWGGLLNIAQENYHNWWLVVVPAVAIFVTVTTFNLVGNGLRDAMDPRLRI